MPAAATPFVTEYAESRRRLAKDYETLWRKLYGTPPPPGADGTDYHVNTLTTAGKRSYLYLGTLLPIDSDAQAQEYVAILQRASQGQATAADRQKIAEATLGCFVGCGDMSAQRVEKILTDIDKVRPYYFIMGLRAFTADGAERRGHMLHIGPDIVGVATSLREVKNEPRSTPLGAPWLPQGSMLN